MIRYPFEPDEVNAKIDLVAPGWRQKAKDRTAKFVALGRYQEGSAIWSKVKPVYIQLQHEKCVFCERKLEGEPYGSIEWDLEHFRPKSDVAEWPDPARHPDLSHANLGAASKSGYYWLAYEIGNYAASCKVCNTIFKLNWFPIGGTRAEHPQVDLLLEQPMLCLPLGNGDEDPENPVTFSLTTAVPKYQTGPRSRRGKIIIDFFGLNKRDNLHRGRAQMIGAFGSLLTARDNGYATPAVLQTLDRSQLPYLQHAACVRAFLRLWNDDPVTARRGHGLCLAYGFDPAAAPPHL